MSSCKIIRDVPLASPQFFYYHSKAFPQTEGLFKDRVSWQGDVNRGDASLQLRNLTLNDNGTFICTVRNPPDVHGNVAKTVLTVTPRGKEPRCLMELQLQHRVVLQKDYPWRANEPD